MAEHLDHIVADLALAERADEPIDLAANLAFDGARGAGRADLAKMTIPPIMVALQPVRTA